MKLAGVNMDIKESINIGLFIRKAYKSRYKKSCPVKAAFLY